MDQELIAYLETRFNHISQQIESLREETSQRFEHMISASSRSISASSS